VDVALLDSLVAMTDIVTNFWSLGMERGDVGASIMNAFRAADGWFVIYVGREAAFELLARLIGREEWLEDDQIRQRESWAELLEPVIRPGIEDWARTRTRAQACAELGAAGIPAGPSFTAGEVVTDPHIAARHMLVEVPRGDGVEQPVLVPGNPVKLSRVAEGPEGRIPWLGEHTRDVLGTELSLSETELDELARGGVIA
jgi:formyl-CoA transferase